jgi:hypothetical protein
MKTMMLGLMLAVGAVMLSGCGADLCAKAADCAKKAGESFSETQCRTDQKTNRELASTKGCGSQFDELANCIAGLSCDQVSSQTGVLANCGAAANAFSKCMQ